MNDTPMLLSSLQSRLKTRSMGMKLIVVCGLALAMTIPALFVEGWLKKELNEPSMSPERSLIM